MPIISTIVTSVTTAAAAAGVSTFTYVASWVASSVALGGLSALVAKNRRPDNNVKDFTRTQAFSSGPALYPLGRCRTGGVVIFWGEDWNVPNTERFNRNGGADDAHIIMAVGEGECDAIEAVWVGNERFEVKFEDKDKKIYTRREQEKLNRNDPQYAAKLAGLPIDLDPGSEAYFNEVADAWFESPRAGARRLNPDNDGDAETIRRAALSGAISIWPYLDASGSVDNFKSVRQYTDDLDNPDLHRTDGQPVFTKFGASWGRVSHRAEGVACLHIRLRQWTKHKIDQRVFRGDVPQISFLLRGMVITHPDPNSSTGTIKQWTNNAAAVRYWWHTVRRGLDADAINREEFVRAYNICEERVIPTRPAEWDIDDPLTPEWSKDDEIWGFRRYSINGVLESGEDPSVIEREFDLQWQGSAVEDGGQYMYFPGSSDIESDVIEVDGEDALSYITINTAPAISDRINALTVNLNQSSFEDYDRQTLEEIRDDEKIEEVDLGLTFPSELTFRWTNNPAQAYMLAIGALRRHRYSTTYSITLPPGDDDSPLRYIEMTAGRAYALTIPKEGVNSKRVTLVDKQVDANGIVTALFIDSPVSIYTPTYDLPDIPAPPPYTPTRLGARPVKPTGLKVNTIARTSSDGTVHFQITASVDANPLRVKFRLTAGNLVLFGETEDNTYTFDVNTDRVQMELAAFHLDSSGIESLPARLIFTPDYTHVIMPTPRWDDVSHYGAQVVMKFKPEEFTNAVSGVEVMYTRLDLNTTADLPVLTESNWTTLGELLTTYKLQIVHGLVMTATGIVNQSGRYNLYARYVSNVSGSAPIRGPISAVYGIVIEVPDDNIDPATPSVIFDGTMYNLDKYEVKAGAAKGETILMMSHKPASAVRFDNWNGNVSNSSITTEPLPAWPFGRCVGYGSTLDENGRNYTTGLWTGGNSTLYRTLPIDLSESKRVDVRAEVFPFEPSTSRVSAITFGGITIPVQKWKSNVAIPSVTFPQASGNFGHITYSIEGLPAGISFNPNTRVVSGTPGIATANGAARYIATDASGGVATITFSWTISATVPTPGVMGLITVDPGITSAVASWGMAANASEYKVEISSTSASSGFTLVGNTVLLTIDLPSLTASTNYWVRVRGVSSGGEGQPAVKAFTTRAAIVIPSTPTGFQAIDKTNDRILLRWDAHSNENYYDIRWKLQTAATFPSANVKSSLQINTTSISGLSTLTAYHIQLRAGNSAGVSAWTDSLSVTTADLSTTAAQIVSIDHIAGVRPYFSVTTNTLSGETGTEVSRQLVSDDGRLDTSVHIQYEDSGTGPFLVYNVAPGRTYRLGVRKTFFPDDGNNLNRLNRATPWVYETVVFTSVLSPPKPVLLQTDGADYNALSVYARSVVGGTAYRFKWWPTSSPTNVSQAIVTYTPPAGAFYEQSIPYRISQLLDETEYSVTVEAQNTEGWSNPSTASKFTTTKFEGTPAEITGLEVYPITATSVALIWSLDSQAETYEIEHDGNPSQLVVGVKGDAEIDRVYLPENKGVYIFESLSPNTAYVFTIRGRNSKADTEYGPWADWDSVTTPFETLQNNPFTFSSSPPITLSKGSGRVIAFSLTTAVDSSVHSFQVRFKERQYNTSLPVNVSNYTLVPNAAVNTFSSGTRTFIGSFDPGWSNRDWDISIRGYVKDGNGQWDSGFGAWVDMGSVFRNGMFQLSTSTPTLTQIPGFITTEIRFDPHTEEFEIPGGTLLGTTANIVDLRINGVVSPIKSTTFTPGSTTPIREGYGAFDPNIWDESGALIGTGSVITTTERGRTRAARVQLNNIRAVEKVEAAVSNGYIDGDKYGDFLYNDNLEDSARFVPVKFTNLGRITSLSLNTTYWALRDVTTVNGQKVIGYFLYNSENGARTGTDEVVYQFNDPNIFLSTYDWATARIEADGFGFRQIKVGDRIEARILRTDPNQSNSTSAFASITLIDPASVPGAPTGAVRNIRYTISGRDVVFDWDEVEGVDGYEVSVEEDIPGEPYQPEGGAASSTFTAVEQVSAARSFTKTGGRNEHFKISIRTYTGNNYSEPTEYVYAPPPGSNTVGKVLGFTADDISDNVRLRWGRVNNATGYELSISTDNGATWGTPITTTQLQYVLVGYSNSDFNVRIRAYRGDAAPYTYSLSYTILSWHQDADEGAGGVGAVKSLVAVSRDGAVFLDWTSAPSATRYAIQYYTNNTWVEITDQIASSTTAWQTTISDANNTDFRVRGETDSANGPWTQVNYIAESDTTLASPTVSSISSYTTLTVNWTKVGGADAYEVQYRPGSSGDWINASLNATAAPVVISSLEDGAAYQVRVRAKEGTNAGTWSAIHNAATLLCTGISAPTGLTLTPTASVLRVAWNRRSEATGYIVEVYTSQSENTGYTRSGVHTIGSGATSVDVSPSPNPPYWARVRVRARQGDCPATNWSAYQTVRWEPHGIIVTPDAPWVISETGGPFKIGVRLTTQPTADVSVHFDENLAAVRSRGPVTAGERLTFTPANWAVEQEVTITPANPDPDNIDNTYTGGYDIVANGGGYNNVRKLYDVTFKDSGAPDLILSAEKADINENSSTSINIKLQKQPTASVSVSISSGNTSVATVNKSSMTFTTSNWNTNQSFTITAPLDNDYANSSTSIRVASAGGGYNNIVKTIPVNVTDISQGLVLDTTSISLEEGSSAIVRAKLAGSPNGFATIRASSADTGAVTISPAFRNYNNTNWDTYQNFTVTASHDNDHRDESVNVTFEGGLAYTNAPDVVVPVTVKDDDNRNLDMSTTSVSMQETGSANVGIRLTSPPVGGDVVVRGVVGNTSVATVSPTTRTFSTSNWNTRQNFVIAGVNDTTLVQTRTTTTAFTTSGGGYDDRRDVSVTVTDNSSPQVFLSSYTFTSKGTPSDALIKLTHQPTGNVTVAISVSNINGTITSNKTSLVFTPSDWNTAQAVTLNGTGGGSLNARASVVFNPSGGGYDSAPSYTLNARFNDTGTSVTARIETSVSTLNLNEGQISTPITMRVYPAGSYRVALTASPSNKVNFSYSSINTDSQGRVNTGLRITALQDTDSLNESVSVTLSATRISGSGASIPNKVISVNVEDDDAPVVRDMNVSKTTLGSINSPLNTGNASSRTIGVRLTSRPTGSVRVNLGLNVSTGTSSNLRLSTNNLTFTTSNWNFEQTFTLDGSSTTLEFDATGSITIDPSGGGYDSTATVSVPFTIVDPVDAPELYIQGGAPTSLEEGDTLTLNLRMRNQAGRAYIVTPSASPSGIFTFNNSSYETVNGRVPNLVITALHDADTDEESATITLTPARGSAGSYPVPAPLSFTLRRTDDDVNVLVPNPTSLSVKEAASKNVAIRLGTIPTGSVTVTPSWSISDPDASFSPANRTFTTSNWSTPQNFTIKGDVSSFDTRDLTLRFTPSGGGYSKVLNYPVKILNEDEPFNFAYRNHGRPSNINPLTLLTALLIPGSVLQLGGPIMGTGPLSLQQLMQALETALKFAEQGIRISTVAGGIVIAGITSFSQYLGIVQVLEGSTIAPLVNYNSATFYVRGLELPPAGETWQIVLIEEFVIPKTNTSGEDLLDDDIIVSRGQAGKKVIRSDVTDWDTTFSNQGRIEWHFIQGVPTAVRYAVELWKITSEDGPLGIVRSFDQQGKIEEGELIARIDSPRGNQWDTLPLGYRMPGYFRDPFRSGGPLRFSGYTPGQHEHPSGSASGAVGATISASTGGIEAEVQAPSNAYAWVEPIVVNPEVSPYIEGELPLMVWTQDDPIDYRIPRIDGGAKPYYTAITGLPRGVRYDSDSKSIIGAAKDTAPKKGVATIRAEDANGNYDQRSFEWVIADDAPQSWSEIGGGLGRMNNPFQIECATKGNIRPLLWTGGATNAHDIVNDLELSRNLSVWFKCPTTYPHIVRLRGAASPDFDVIVKVGDDWYISDTDDDMEYLSVPGHQDGALICIYRYAATTTSSGSNNTGDPLILEWVPSIAEGEDTSNQVGGASGAIQVASTDSNEVTGNASTNTRVPGTANTDIYILHRNGLTGAWSRETTPLSSGWNEVPHDARQICFEFHFKEWENRAVRRISTHYRDHED